MVSEGLAEVSRRHIDMNSEFPEPIHPATGACRLLTAILGCMIAASLSSAATPPPAPHGAVPAARQVRWAKETDVICMFNFSTITYTGKEWGYGDEPAASFDPKEFDAPRLVRELKAAGIKGMVINAKHHGGFCLWPSAFNDHYTVGNTPWRNGKGDMIRELADACRAEGLKVGIYLSPWDRNHKDYGKPEYVAYFHNQLRELMTGYGELFEIWFDGANGGDGYYGGARTTRRIGPDYYQWDKVMAMARELQPAAVCFNREDIRWVGNESGTAGDPCWGTIDTLESQPPLLNTGQRNGKTWAPAEADFPLHRSGWFWKPGARPRTPAQLVDLYFASVGRNSAMDVGIAPDTRGLLTAADVESLKGFGKRIEAIFSNNLAASATFSASDVRGGAPEFAPANVRDGWQTGRYWSTGDAVLTPALVMDFGRPWEFSVVSLREHIALGERVDDWALDCWRDGEWSEFARGSCIGMRRLWRGEPIVTEKIRLRIIKAAACPAIAEFAAYLEPPESRRESNMKAPAFTRGLPKAGWKIVSVGCEGSPAAKAFDNDPNTIWHTHPATGPQGCPQSLVWDMGRTHDLTGFLYLPRQDQVTVGNIASFTLHASTDGMTWGVPVAQGEFANILANPVEQRVMFPRPVSARYLKFTALRSANGIPVAVAEIGVLGK